MYRWLRIEALRVPLLVFAAGFTGLLSPGIDAQPAGPNTRSTETLCRTCHGGHFEALAGNPHSVLDTAGWRERTGREPGCLNCHGDVSTHINEFGGRGNVFAFREETPAAINAVCLGCHASSHPEFERSAHAQAGLSCVDCHAQHEGGNARQALLRDTGSVLARLENTGEASRVCVDCHQETFIAFSLNERHRLLDGVLECVSCHDPHAAETRIALGGFKQQQCLECHADKGGPFVFEHGASRVDGCTSCHAPHGSPNRHLLSHQRQGELCISCHAVMPQFHVGFSPSGPPRFDLDTQCTNCHSMIHGSNFDPAFLQ